MAATDVSQASKWPAFRPYLAAATIAVLVTSIVLSILAFRDPEMVKWGWASAGVAALTLSIATAMIYAIYKYKQNEALDSSMNTRKQLPLMRGNVFAWLLQEGNALFYEPFYEDVHTFRDPPKPNSAGEEQLKEIKQGGLLDVIPKKEIYKQMEKEMICYLLGSVDKRVAKQVASRILEELSEKVEDHGDDFIIHLMELYMGQKFDPNLKPNDQCRELISRFKEITKNYSYLPDWARQ